jgi:two-component system, NarL family, nitrate/nitrite response regulator NarL
MRGIRERLDSDFVIGAEGYLFELERRGYLKAGPFVPEVVLDFPEAVRELHREMLRAGAEVMVAFTYYGHRDKLRSIGREDDLEPLNRQALRIAREKQPEILLLDISMPGGGLSAIESILAIDPTRKIVMLTVSEMGEDVTAALSRGARGYVLKGVGSRALADILRTVAAGESYVSPTLSARLLSDLSTQPNSAVRTGGIADLTAREGEILNLVSSGLSNKRVALQLNLHEKTVKHHMTRILAKLNVSNRTEAAIAFREASARRNGSIAH